LNQKNEVAEESKQNKELVEAKVGNTENIFERLLMDSDVYEAVSQLSFYMDLFNGSDQIIDEKL